MAKNLEELRREDPELAAAVEAEIKAAMKQNPAGTAADVEKKRLQEIDAIAPAVNNPALVHEAKYGEKACSAQELAYRALCLNKDIDKGIEAAKQAYRLDNPDQQGG